MVAPGAPDMVPLVSSYHEYFARAETNPFTAGEYGAVLVSYAINSTNPDAASAPKDISQHIYTAAHKEALTAFLL